MIDALTAAIGEHVTASSDTTIVTDIRPADVWPPKSFDLAEAEILELSCDIEGIQSQLSNKDHRDEDGNRLNDHEYHQWRYRAVFAMRKKVDRRRRLKAWVKAANMEANRIEAGIERPGNAVELMGALIRVIKDVVGGENLTPQEQALVHLAQQWIRSKGAPAVVTARQQTQAVAS